MLITLGFTNSDRADDYSSFTDGYRLSATQHAVTIALSGDLPDLSGAEWAEAAYVATNSPVPPTDRAAAAIRAALDEQVRTPLRSLSAGDTVTVAGHIWACDRTGWHRVDAGTPRCHPAPTDSHHHATDKE
jgi:hypothetical protein